MTEEAALAGIRVVDAAGSIATGYCGKLFADHGAVVVNAEPPDGFATRWEAPFLPGVPAPENSALHAWLSTNKASAVALSADDIRDLARGAQVVLDDGRFDCDDFAVAAPNVVVSTVTWFGRTGPYAHYQGTDGVVQSLIGMVRGIGREEGPPILPAGCQAQIVGGLAAYIGTLGQVLAREIGNASGPVRLDTSIFEANLCFTEVGGVGGHRSGRRVRRMGVNRYPPTYPLGIYPCRDGWLGVTALTPSQWKSFCALLDMPEFADVPQYQSAIGRLQDAEMLDPLIHERVREQSANELFNRGQGARIPLALVPTMEQLFTVDQYVARRAFDEVRPPGQEGFAAPVTPFRLFRTPAIRGGDVAALGSMAHPSSGKSPASVRA